MLWNILRRRASVYLPLLETLLLLLLLQVFLLLSLLGPALSAAPGWSIWWVGGVLVHAVIGSIILVTTITIIISTTISSIIARNGGMWLIPGDPDTPEIPGKDDNDMLMLSSTPPLPTLPRHPWRGLPHQGPGRPVCSQPQEPRLLIVPPQLPILSSPPFVTR